MRRFFLNAAEPRPEAPRQVRGLVLPPLAPSAVSPTARTARHSSRHAPAPPASNSSFGVSPSASYGSASPSAAKQQQQQQVQQSLTSSELRQLQEAFDETPVITSVFALQSFLRRVGQPVMGKELAALLATHCTSPPAPPQYPFGAHERCATFALVTRLMTTLKRRFVAHAATARENESLDAFLALSTTAGGDGDVDDDGSGYDEPSGLENSGLSSSGGVGRAEKQRFVSAQELRRIVNSYRLNIDIDALIALIDTDGSGEIDADEFNFFLKRVAWESDLSGDKETPMANVSTGDGDEDVASAHTYFDAVLRPAAAPATGKAGASRRAPHMSALPVVPTSPTSAQRRVAGARLDQADLAKLLETVSARQKTTPQKRRSNALSRRSTHGEASASSSDNDEDVNAANLQREHSAATDTAEDPFAGVAARHERRLVAASPAAEAPATAAATAFSANDRSDDDDDDDKSETSRGSAATKEGRVMPLANQPRQKRSIAVRATHVSATPEPRRGAPLFARSEQRQRGQSHSPSPAPRAAAAAVMLPPVLSRPRDARNHSGGFAEYSCTPAWSVNYSAFIHRV